ncbi:MAG: cbb3-type cytochrome c oxidase subunit I [Cyclobacteriaceae bacterium]|jgi:cytochrome c oxidase cbb3-type subunit 1|nr:cbb3-type cytochrome c oxidase subunit I [Cyclobacteriaceae bacterium]
MNFSKNTLACILAVASGSLLVGCREDVLRQPGIIGTLVLAGIVLMVVCVFIVLRLNRLLSVLSLRKAHEDREALKEEILNLEDHDVDELLQKRRAALEFRLAGTELSGEQTAEDSRGIVRQVSTDDYIPVVAEKKAPRRIEGSDPELSRLVVAFAVSAALWLVLGTGVGQYLGMKFIWPEIDGISWLSFGRLRPVHTNMVFWGWASIAMLGLGYFVVARTSNTRIYSLRWGWITWWLVNTSVLIGTLCLMNGINNGGGEYREYIWPVAALFAAGLFLTLLNFYRTVARRKTTDIYISNWYILAGLIWTLVLVIIGYLPFYQEGLGETVIQGYYMHQGVGMWFMTFTLGLVYYYLPRALNKPIYSYALGILAFWTQMLFYTMIGTHHFIFSPLPWWLQTVAIVFSMGMFIPVIAGTTNFLMTMRGSWDSIRVSYVIPFLLVGVIFYFVGSSQGSFQAFRFTNYVWHFTDFNVAHSHMTMYGIITFFLWGCLYFILPQLTGRRPKPVLVGIHFWFALLGLMAYMFSMMIGGTMKGLSWMEGHPFIESVVLMMPYWVWRAVGGSLMFLSHVLFAINIYTMCGRFLRTRTVEIPKSTA